MIRRESPLILGSASPRRHAILSELGLAIAVVRADVPETPGAGEGPHEFLSRIVMDKLQAVVDKLPAGPFAGVLVADTIVVVDDAILNKPEDRADAVRLLRRIVGRSHTVYTRYAISREDRPAEAVVERTVETRVTMRAASETEIEAYADTGEGLDKAGAYAAQGIGTFLIERIDGSYSNVVGLPACEVVLDLLRVGLIERFP